MKIKVCSYIILSIFISFISLKDIYASNEGISINPSFIYEDKIFAPGSIEYSDFYITNNNKENIKIDRFYMKLKKSTNLELNQMLDENNNEFKELSRNTIVKLKYKDKILFNEKLENIISDKGVLLSEELDIKPNEKELLNMTIDVGKEMNNDAQSLENIFSMGVSYKINDTNPPVKPDPPVTPPTNPDPSVKPDTGVNNESNKLPQTGGIINSASLLMIGAIAIGAGIFLNNKVSKDEGGKSNE